jgi:hypothetical protein
MAEGGPYKAASLPLSGNSARMGGHFEKRNVDEVSRMLNCYSIILNIYVNNELCDRNIYFIYDMKSKYSTQHFVQRFYRLVQRHRDILKMEEVKEDQPMRSEVTVCQRVRNRWRS